MRCSPRKTFLLIGIMLVLAGLGCNAVLGGEPTPAPQTQAEPEQEQPSEMEDATPEVAVSPTVFEVYIDDQPNLYYLDGMAVVQQAYVDMPVSSEAGVFDALASMYPAKNGIYWVDDSGEIPVAKLADLNAVVQNLPSPTSNGELVGILPSPYDGRLAWLMEVSEVDPSPFAECDPAAGCVGWQYEVYLTDATGKNPQLVGSHEGGVERAQPTLTLLQWGSDANSLYLRWDSNVPSMFYPAVGGGLVKLDLNSAQFTEITQDWLLNRTISPDGKWVVTFEDMDTMLALDIADAAGSSVYQVPNNADLPYLVSEPLFAPDSSSFYYITLEKGGASILSIQLKQFNLSSGSEKVVADLMPYLSPDLESPLPTLGGWSGNGLLILHHVQGSVLLDPESGEATQTNGQQTISSIAWLIGTVGE